MTSETQFPNYVRFNEERCTGCAACLRVCPTKAIRIRHHRSIRIVTQCIGCGACGAPDCRTLAEDVVRGEASLNDCIWLQARRTKKKVQPADAGDD